MSKRIPQSRADLESKLAEQLEFIRASARAFDDGFEGEAKRLAVAIRILVHDKGSSTSLLGQLGMKDLLFFDTALDVNPRNLLTHMGLVGMHVGSEGTKYVALLGESPRGQGTPVPFRQWWEKVVFVDDRRATLTREELILSVANQDGGAHIDPALNETYARLSRENSMAWMASGPSGARPVERVHLPAVRQVAFEVETSLKKGLRSLGLNATQLSTPGRNDPCYCGSGRKYKRCHGAAV